MKVHYPKLYNMAHLLASNVLLLPKDLTIIFIIESGLIQRIFCDLEHCVLLLLKSNQGKREVDIILSFLYISPE